MCYARASQPQNTHGHLLENGVAISVGSDGSVGYLRFTMRRGKLALDIGCSVHQSRLEESLWGHQIHIHDLSILGEPSRIQASIERSGERVNGKC